MGRFPTGLHLALGGGGARGFAHVGVLEVLKANGLRVDSIVGTSSGAIAGAGFALGYDSAQMRRRVLEFAASPLAQDARVRALVAESEENECRSLGDRVGRIFCRGRMFKSLLLGPAVFEAEFFRKIVHFFLPDVAIESMPMPFATVATDVLTGRSVVIDRGSLREAVVASCAVPGVTPLVEHQGRMLMDGGVTSLVPVLEARARGAKPLLAVCVDRDINSDSLPRQALELYLRAGDIQGSLLSELTLRQADLVLKPGVGSIHWMDFAKGQLIMDLGHDEAKRRLEQIALLLDGGLRARLGRAWRAGLHALEGNSHGGTA